MRFQNDKLKLSRIAFILLYIIIISQWAYSQEEERISSEREKYISVAIEIMTSSHYCGLITLDQSGQAHIRTMEPFTPEENMVIWLGTNSNSRKIKEIRNNPNVTLYYADNEVGGYVVIDGTARLVEDPKDKTRYWREEWETIFPGWKDNFYTLIEVTPVTLEILSYQHGIIGDPETWEVPHFTLKNW